MTMPPAEDDEERERAIVEEAVAALRGEPAGAAGTDHAAARHRVRVVLEAIEAAGGSR